MKPYSHRSFVIGAIGRLSPEKNFFSLINAVARMIRGQHDVSLIIIGEGGERRKLEELALAKGIKTKVFLPGYLEHADQYLRLFDLFVMSSLTEGLPVTLLEAMRAGVPIVATSVGGIPEALDGGKCGLLVAPADENALAETMIKLYHSQEWRAKLSWLAKERLEKVFSSQMMVLKYSLIYKELLQCEHPKD